MTTIQEGSYKGALGTDVLEEQLSRLTQIENEENRVSLTNFIVEKSNIDRAGTLKARLDALIPFAKHCGEKRLVDATREDIIFLITNHRYTRGIHNAKDPSKLKARPLSKSSRYQWHVQIMSYLKWALKTKETPPQMIDLPFKKREAGMENARAKNLSNDQLRSIFNASISARDRALVAISIDSGCRAGELASIQFTDLVQRHGVTWIRLNPAQEGLKTGPRIVDIPLVKSQPVLDAWLKEHPTKEDKNSYLFVSTSNRNRGAKCSSKTLSAAFKRAADRAGIDASIHWCRHTSAANSAATGLPTSVLRLLFGWSKTSNMPAHYINVVEQYDYLVLKNRGIDIQAENAIIDNMGSTACLICGELIEFTQSECGSCGMLANRASQETATEQMNDAAIDFVAISVASKLMDAPEGGFSLFEAVRALRGWYKEHCKKEPRGKEFTDWALREYSGSAT